MTAYPFDPRLIIDSSALLAIAFGEPERDQMIDLMRMSDANRISAGNWLEVFIVIETRRWAAAVARLETFMAQLQLDVVAVTLEQAEVARHAHQRFGRGNHPARLNYGDCFAYALAKVTGEPLLFKGNDFSQTDIRSAFAV